MKKLNNVLRLWLPFAVSITMLCALMYVAVQQNYRNGLNDPQIQIAEDFATNFKTKDDAAGLDQSGKTDISSSLATFGIAYDKEGKAIGSSAVLNGQTPTLPNGTLAEADKSGQNIFTWEPQKGVRLAAVVNKAEGGYILIGRNMREGEKRINELAIMVGVGYLATLLATFVSIYLLETKKTSK